MTQRKRNILLIEPPYKNKYPPLGLMKIATYHRMLGDNITFYKGKIKEFIIQELLEECLNKLSELHNAVNWRKRKPLIRKFITTKQSKILDEILLDVENTALLELWLKSYGNIYKKYRKDKQIDNPKFDRVYITTLFTFHWDITVRTINDAKVLLEDMNELKVGGVLASLLPKELEGATGIKPITGLLDKPGILDENDIIIDDLPLDYSILDEIDYKYPTGSAYFTFMTKGCTRTCSFCAVPKLEPIYKEKILTQEKFDKITELYGEQRHLLLMDNNVLASPKFPDIIQEIKDMGFVKGAKYYEPNQLDIAIKNLQANLNDKAYIKRSYNLLRFFLNHRVKGKTAQKVYDIYDRFNLLNLETITKDNLLEAYKEIKDIYEKYRNKIPQQRYVDFNQGVDARCVTDEYMKLLSEIPIYPLRIAFDYIGLEKRYTDAVRLAAKYGIKRLSNYLLFNFKDKPGDLFLRMRINIDLSEELDIHIYSFPMKYIPLFGDDAKNRQYIGKFWNRKFLRAIQSISNVTKGIVPPGRSFFEKAYGSNIDEYFELLYMPETYLIYRRIFEDLGYTQEWKYLFNKVLTKEEKDIAKKIIESNDFNDIKQKTTNTNVMKLLRHYKISRDDVKNSDPEYLQIRTKFDDIIKSDQFLELTTTYEYETEELVY